MPAQLLLEFPNDAAYRAALDRLAGLNVTIRRTSDLFHTVSVIVPDELVQVVRTLPGLTNVIKDIVVRPACCELQQAQQLVSALGEVSTSLGLWPQAQAGSSRSWEDFTVEEPAVHEFMKLPKDLTGDCVRVAVLDTGVNSTHPALRGRVKRKVIVADGNPEDAIGHGTWVAGAIAGQEVDSPLGLYRGVAPGAQIINVNVLDNEGNGVLSDLLAGLEACANLGVPLINMSLGAPVDLLFDPMQNAVEKLAQMGIIVVVAAGNNGPFPGTIGTPGSAPHAITVGAASVPIDGYIAGRETAEFSSRGPTLRTFMKPDVVAPGGAGGTVQRPQMIYGPAVGLLDAIVDGEEDDWGPLRGSSMATPHITGLIACLLERYTFTRAQLYDALSVAALRQGWWQSFDQGWGFIDGQRLADYFERRGFARSKPNGG